MEYGFYGDLKRELNIEGFFSEQKAAWYIARIASAIKEMQKHERFYKDFDKTIEIKQKKKYIPPMSHPWKLASFKKQMQKAHTDHVYA